MIGMLMWGIVALVGVDVGLRLSTGKGLFGHIRSCISDIDDKLNKWIQKKQQRGIHVKKIVFVIKLCETPVQLLDKGLMCVETVMFGVGKNSRGKMARYKFDTGEKVRFAIKSEDAEKLKEKQKIEAELTELALPGKINVEKKSKDELEILKKIGREKTVVAELAELELS